MSFSFVIWV